MNHILITGGSGLLGQKLTTELLNRGYSVSHLSRHTGTHPNVKTFLWDVKNNIIDVNCIRGVDVIIHLAGEGIADGKWTHQRKKDIINSRTKSIALVYSLLKTKPHKVKSVISASGVGYYGDSGDILVTEDSQPSKSFLGECCVKWEKAVDKGTEFELRIVKFRTGVVLTTQGGALAKMAAPVKYGFGAVLGSGKQWVPWIHIEDAVNMYILAVENEMIKGVYNMVAPLPVTNYQLTLAIAKQLERPLWLPHVPAFALNLFLGEMAVLVLGSNKVAANKIEKAGFTFKYLTVEDALEEIYG
ncbi:hypothetical protein BDD43_1780 [Mucilaginibacter gracilis]|uniref:TIGR01777 family protein n=1 Tax=Mucilaginibacter gracilis TaxID=423350 RepID=A0A495IY49_9SPHI|nr:TIGR01777 family oxidoreductase [Mucilaginibacter gracilis]RKR81630.1 hypothetical protein BDD43_1780 [Mucilaginibacter gracilis]